MFCILNPKNCVVDHANQRTPEKCARCGFNLDEHNRRIADIRKNGLQTVRRGIKGYVVKYPKDGRK